MLHRSVLLLWAFVAVAMAFGIFARPSSTNNGLVRQSKSKSGSLKLCPPGGPSFLDAFNLICPMRRRRRSLDSMDDSSTLEKTMHKCCEQGCEFADIFPICNPFG
ncbi:unnamed protein product [Nippostrongylus brasiliensis]|uniref:Ceinsulin-2 (inferred by orthology to a C. elegans protein) n=1 Tax=Nippostrongylus brasiliensis TaxID=27835 RepID=A0A0N4XDF2_NIPBR|nr:hypothetical protein Q1695_014688 [Nippostrongylus brasiliensis]VDL63276.1 unnamed protein product [Nippostrongylus brasiliensis]